MDHLLRVHRIQRWRTRPRPTQVGIALVLENRDAVLAGQCEQLLAALARQDRAGRVLDRRDRIDVFRYDIFSPEVLEDPSERIDPQAVVIERRADDVDAEALELGQRAALSEFFENDGVAALEQQLIDKIDALPGAGGDQDIIRRAFDGGAARDLVDDEIAQPTIALRPVKIVEGQVSPPAP